jgi:hypothetical protein
MSQSIEDAKRRALDEIEDREYRIRVASEIRSGERKEMSNSTAMLIFWIMVILIGIIFKSPGLSFLKYFRWLK